MHWNIHTYILLIILSIFLNNTNLINISMFQPRALQWNIGEYILWPLPLGRAARLFWSPGFLRRDHHGNDDNGGDGENGEDEDDYDYDYHQFGDDCWPYRRGDFIVSPRFWPHVTNWQGFYSHVITDNVFWPHWQRVQISVSFWPMI